MMQFKPMLNISRVVIIRKDGQIAYDELFHTGINIIRGFNGSGKSTIANFIFYVLGGDYKNWTDAALNCDSVYAEVKINDASLTIKRTVSESSMQPMYVFWDTYDNASKNSSMGWEVYSYKSYENKRSFSNILFEMLGIPQSYGDFDSNLTMNQLLRLLYIDQISPTDSLFKAENFDSALTRKVIAEILLGVYDSILYSDRIILREIEKDYETKKQQLDGLKRIYRSIGNELNPDVIKEEIYDAEQKIIVINNQLAEIENKRNIKPDRRRKLLFDSLIKEVQEQKEVYNNLSNQINDYNLEVEDSKHFIELLENRKLALKDSIQTRDSFEEVTLTHCPNCLSELNTLISDTSCFLCKQVMPEKNKTHILRMQKEIENQIIESSNLLKQKEESLIEMVSQHNTIQTKLFQTQRKVDEFKKDFKSTREQQSDQLLINKGNLESKINFLLKDLKAVEQIVILDKEIVEWEQKISVLRKRIANSEFLQIERFNAGIKKIAEFSLEILRNDLERQKEFKEGIGIEINFEKDTYSLDGKNNFSASSNVYLKNSIRFGMFFASLEYSWFRYPRFILCDNTEDKGMEEIRSQNFQKVIKNISDRFEIEHQIILTTSAIADEFDNTELCVGEFYTADNKTLSL